MGNVDDAVNIQMINENDIELNDCSTQICVGINLELLWHVTD